MSTADAILIGISGTSFVDSTVTAGTNYYYWAKAMGLCGISAFSNRDRGRSVSCP